MTVEIRPKSLEDQDSYNEVLIRVLYTLTLCWKDRNSVDLIIARFVPSCENGLGQAS